MRNEQDPRTLVIVPFANLLALTAIVLFGHPGLLATFLVMLVYHWRFTAKTALLADVTLALTVLPIARIVAFLYDFSLVHYVESMALFALLLVGVSALGKALQASRLKFNHPL